MFQTVFIDEHARALDLKNIENAIVRHCKIGKVVSKMNLLPIWPANPLDWWQQPRPMYDTNVCEAGSVSISRVNDAQMHSGAYS